MKRAEQQLTLPGVELASLELWKLANGVYTGEIKGLAWNIGGYNFASWSIFESPVIFICQNPPGDMGYGGDEKEAILQYCEKAEIDKPDWWQ